MARAFHVTAPMPRFTGDAAAWRDAVRRIEDLGFDGVAVSDHFTRGWVLEPVVAMAAAALATTTLRVQSLVLGNDYRHPVLLHKAMATLDVLSGGRVDIGIGAGWLPTDYEAAGIPLESPGVRVDRLAESVQVLRGLFGEEAYSFTGSHYRIEALDGLPKPVRPGGPPLLVGGGGRRVLEVAGAYADVVGITARMRPGAVTGRAVEDLTRDRVRQKLGWAHDAAVRAGRDPATLAHHVAVLGLDLTDVRGAQPWVSSMAADADLAALADSPAVLRGTVAACAERLHRDREELGITHVHLGGDPLTTAALVTAIR